MRDRVIAIVFAGALLLSGCGSVRYPRSYTLNVTPRPPRATPSGVPLGSVAIREFLCPHYLADGRIVYRPSPEEVAFYEYHRWAMDPRQALTQLVAETLRGQSLFKSVAAREPGIQAAYVLSGSIDRLEEVDEGRDVRAVCTLSARLQDVRGGSVVWSHTASEVVHVEKRDMTGVVGSLSAAAGIAVDRLVESMTTELSSAQAH